MADCVITLTPETLTAIVQAAAGQLEQELGGCPTTKVGTTGTGDVDQAGNPIVYVDQNGNPIADGVRVINFQDADGNYTGSWV